jgi:hypothetical protein
MFEDILHKKVGKPSKPKKSKREESSEDSGSSESISEHLSSKKRLKRLVKQMRKKLKYFPEHDSSTSESEEEEESDEPKKSKRAIGALPSKRKQVLPRMFEAMKAIDSRFDGCVANLLIPPLLLKDTVEEAPAFTEPLRDGALLKGGDERLQSAVQAQTAGLRYTMRGCERVLGDKAKALNDLTTGAILQMHALSRTCSAMITEGAGATQADIGIAAILSDIPRDAAALIAPQPQQAPFFRDGARGSELSGHTDATDTAAIASAAATAAVAAMLQKPVQEQRAPSLSSSSPPITISEPKPTGQSRTGTPLSRSFTILASKSPRPKKPFTRAILAKTEKQKSRATKSPKKPHKKPGR